MFETPQTSCDILWLNWQKTESFWQRTTCTGDEIDLLVLIGWAINVTGMLFSIYCIGRFHLLVALRYSATVTFLGGLIRVLSTSIGSDTISHETQFWITFAGQIVTSFGTSTVVCMSTKVSF